MVSDRENENTINLDHVANLTMVHGNLCAACRRTIRTTRVQRRRINIGGQVNATKNSCHYFRREHYGLYPNGISQTDRKISGRGVAAFVTKS